MGASAILEQLHDLGVTATAAGEKLRLEPGSRVPPQLVNELRQHKADILAYLSQKQAKAQPYPCPDSALCRNPLTPHSAHEHPWECDPNTCYCYRLFGYPRWCEGVPCRWVWPKGVPGKESEP